MHLASAFLSHQAAQALKTLPDQAGCVLAAMNLDNRGMIQARGTCPTPSHILIARPCFSTDPAARCTVGMSLLRRPCMTRQIVGWRNQCWSFSSFPSLFQLSFSQCEPSFALSSSCKALTGDRKEHVKPELPASLLPCQQICKVEGCRKVLQADARSNMLCGFRCSWVQHDADKAHRAKIESPAPKA